MLNLDMENSKLIKRIIFSLLGKFGYRISTISNLGLMRSFIANLRVIDVKLTRIGSSNDGGYLVPDDLDGIKSCFSPGVANNSDFEFDLSKQV